MLREMYEVIETFDDIGRFVRQSFNERHLFIMNREKFLRLILCYNGFRTYALDGETHTFTDDELINIAQQMHYDILTEVMENTIKHSAMLQRDWLLLKVVKETRDVYQQKMVCA